ncbi:MAG: DUF4157 domain-containing protein, partial [Phormidesmis sp.]
MPDALKSGVEQLSGFDLSGVRVHRNSIKPASLNAHAYAQGHEIHLAPGQAQHLPHEAWHVVQQMQGRVRPTTQAKGVVMNDDTALEQEADRMGKKASQIKLLNKEIVPSSRTSESGNQALRVPTAQRKKAIVQKQDVVEDIVLAGYKEDKKDIKADLAVCIQKFKNAIEEALESLNEEGKEQLQDEMSIDGRDAFFYRSMFKKYKEGLMGDLNNFKADWSVAKTGGLLADIGLALKQVDIF